MHFPVIGECLGWRTTDFEELYGDLGQWSMTKELAREVSGFYLSSPCEVWWIAESVLNMSRSRADGTMSSWLLYFRNFTNFHTVSYIIWTPLWTKCASAAAILFNISANASPRWKAHAVADWVYSKIYFALRDWRIFLKTSFDGFKLALHLIFMKNETMNSNWILVHHWTVGCSENES